jgi:hypothetical protein
MSGGSSRRYPPELRERAVRMVAEISDQHSSEWAAISDVARLLQQTELTQVAPGDVEVSLPPAEADQGLTRFTEVAGSQGGQAAPGCNRWADQVPDRVGTICGIVVLQPGAQRCEDRVVVMGCPVVAQPQPGDSGQPIQGCDGVRWQASSPIICSRSSSGTSRGCRRGSFWHKAARRCAPLLGAVEVACR